MAIGPTPGGFLGARRDDAADDTIRQSPFDAEEEALLHPLVQWAHDAGGVLHSENRAAHNRMKRNRDYYEGNQWNGPRAPWKNNAVMNYCAWVCDQWASVLADNKPKVTYDTYLLEQMQDADIMNAAWEECYDNETWQAIIEDCILQARIDGVAYLHPTYDPHHREGRGDVVLNVAKGDQILMDRDAKGPTRCSLLLYEYFLPLGEILNRWPHLEAVVRAHSTAPGPNQQPGPTQEAPAQLVNVGGYDSTQSIHVPAYSAPPTGPDSGGTGGYKVQEFWQRPRGPRSLIDVDAIKWAADGKPSTRKKFIRFPDGHEEPLMTVVTEGNVVYELPLTDAMIMQHVSDLGGLRVLHVTDALEAVTEPVKAPLFPTGRRTVIVGDYVADDGLNPYGHGRFPFIPIYAYRNPGSKHGISDIDRIATMQEYLNRLYALLLDAAILTSNPIWLIPTESAIADEDVTNAPGAIIRGDIVSLKMARREKAPDMPAYVLQLINLTIQQMREISGLSESATGGKFKGQQAAETVSMYQEAASVRFRQGIRNVEQAMTELGFQFAGLVKQFYTMPRLVKLKDRQGVDYPVSFIGTDLEAPFKLKAKAGGALPLSPSARLNIYMGLMNTPAIDLPEVWRMMAEVGIIDSATAVETRMDKYAKAAGLPTTYKAPGLMAMLGGGQKKGSKNRGGKGGRNAGRSARSTTPAAALGNIAS